MINTILNHKSIRKYKSKNIEDKVLNNILEAGVRASNTGNMQVYSMIVTKSEDIKMKLWESHFKQDMVLQAPVHITFCVDINRFNKWCELRNTKGGYDNFLWFVNGSVDAILASQNVSIAAEAQGLGVCYLGTITYMADKFIEILNIPKGVIPVAAITLGYPDENPNLTDRLPLNGVVHYEKYEDYSENKINEIYSEKENLAETKELINVNNTENLAQIFTQKRYKKEDNIFFSKKYFDILKEQGFFNHE